MFVFFMLLFIFAVYYVLPAMLVVALILSIVTLIEYIPEIKQEFSKIFKRKKKRS